MFLLYFWSNKCSLQPKSSKTEQIHHSFDAMFKFSHLIYIVLYNNLILEYK